jgi:hypothetical protein
MTFETVDPREQVGDSSARYLLLRGRNAILQVGDDAVGSGCER